MSKKKRRNKRKGTTERIKEQEPATVVDVRPDLRKTAVLATACLGILFILYLTQSRWAAVLP